MRFGRELPIAFLAVITCACQHPPTPHVPGRLDEPEPTPLVTGLADERSLAVDGSHVYQIALDTDEILHIRIEQRGQDIETVLPDGRSFDLVLGDHVTEEIWWLAPDSEDIQLTVKNGGGYGDYRLEVVRVGPATEIDRRRVAAFRQFLEGTWAAAPAKEARFQAALDAWKGTENPAAEAWTWAALGKAHLDAKDATRALADYDRAIELAREQPEVALLGRLVHARGQAHKKLWQADAAVADYEVARDLLGQNGDASGEALAVNDMAVIQLQRDDFESACPGFEHAWEVFKRAGYPKEAADAQISLGRCKSELGALPDALPIFLDVLATAPRDHQRTEALREIAWWYRLDGQLDEALEYLNQALDLSPADPASLDRRGTVHLQLGEIEAARRDYEEALEGFENPLEVAHTRASQCYLEQEVGRFDEALDLCLDALEALDRLDSAAAAQVLFRIAGLERRAGRLLAAEARAAEAVRRIEDRRARAGDTELRTAFAAERQDFYQLLIDLRMELGASSPDEPWTAKALEIAELTRTRAFVDRLHSRDVEPIYRADPELRRAEQDLLDEIDRKARDLAMRIERGGRFEAGTEAELTELEERLAEVRRKMRRAAPSYVSLTSPDPLDVPAIQKLLDGDTLLLVYQLGPERAYLWQVDRDSVHGFRLANRDEIERRVRRWYALVGDPENAWADGDPVQRRARQLFDLLLGPVVERLGRHRRLVFIADGSLHRVSFGALPLEGVPLIADHEIVTLPSAAVLSVLRQQTAGRSMADGLIAVVADPVYGPEDDRFPGSRKASVRDVPTPFYQRLSSSAEEARDLLSLASGRTLYLDGFNAHRGRLHDGDLTGFRILHFATHAWSEDSSGGETGLVLSRLDEEGRLLEGLVGLPELYSLDLPAELAVLSACGTGRGEEIAGEGLVSLSRGFMHAGVPRVVVSLWDVRDKAARELMRRFYRALLIDEMPPGAALSRAQASMWRDDRPVRDWGAFVLQGDWRPFPVSASSP